MKLITGTDWKRYANAMFDGISTATKAMKDRLAEVAEEMGSVGKAYRSLMGEFITQADIQTRGQFLEWLQKVHTLAGRVAAGGGSLEDLTNAFNALTTQGAKFGYLGKEFHRLMESLAGTGLAAQYIADELQRGAEGYAAYIQAGFSTVVFQTFQEILDFKKKIADNQQLIDGVRGLSTTFNAYANTVKLDSEAAYKAAEIELQKYQVAAVDAYNAMRAAGFTEKESLKEIQPILATLIALQNDYGFAVDGNTQALIDQAREHDISLEKQLTAEEKMIAAQEKMVQLLETICLKFGGELPYNVELFAASGENAFNRITGKTGEWGAALDVIGRQLRIGIPDAVTDLDSLYTEKMTGHSMVTQTKLLEAALLDVDGILREDLQESVTNLDENYSKMGEAVINVSEGIWDKIHKLTDAGKDVHAATSIHFADVIREAELSETNLDRHVSRIGEIFNDYRRGTLSLEETQKAAGASFAAILNNVVELGQEGSRSMIQLLQKARETGVEVAEMKDYIDSKLNQSVSGLGSYMSTFTGDNAAAGIQANWQFMQSTALSTFQALRVEGHSFIETVGMMQGELTGLAGMATENGLEVSEGLKKMLDMAAFIDTNKELTTRIEATRTIMEALGDSAFMTAADFSMFADQTIQQFNDIFDATGDVDMALNLISPNIESLSRYSESYGFALSDEVQALIDQAAGFNRINEPVEELTSKIQDDLPESIADLDEYFNTVSTDMLETLHDLSDQSAFSTAISELSELQQRIITLQGLTGIEITDSPDPTGGGEYISAAVGYRGVLNEDTWFRAHEGEYVNIVPKDETRHRASSPVSQPAAIAGDTVINNFYFPETVEKNTRESIVEAVKEALEDDYKGFRVEVKEMLQ